MLDIVFSKRNSKCDGQTRRDFLQFWFGKVRLSALANLTLRRHP
jgi:hypothetical protein